MPRSRDENKIADIYAAAMRLVIRTGFYALKMADVAREAGLATGTIYIYFPDKEALINNLFRETKKEIAGTLFSPQHEGATFYETFRNMWFAYFRFCRAQPEKMLFVEQFVHSGLLSEESIQAMHMYFKPLDEFLYEARVQKLIRDIDTELLKAQLMGPIHEIIKIAIQQKILLTESMLEDCFGMAWNSVRL